MFRHAAAVGAWWIAITALYVFATTSIDADFTVDILAMAIEKRWGLPPAVSVPAVVVLPGLVAAIATALLVMVERWADPERIAARAFVWAVRAAWPSGWAIGIALAVWALAAAATGDWVARATSWVLTIAYAAMLPFATMRRDHASGAPEAWRPRRAWPGWRVFGWLILLWAAGWAVDEGGRWLPAAAALVLATLTFAVDVYLLPLSTGLWVEGSSGGLKPVDVARTAARAVVLRSSLAFQAIVGIYFAWALAPLMAATLFLVYDMPQLESATGARPWFAVLLRAVSDGGIFAAVALLAAPALLASVRLWVTLVPENKPESRR